MSGDWASSPNEHGPSHEYETVAELWVSNKTGFNRKLPQQRKKASDKRDSVAQLSALTDATPKRLREKSSWLGMTRGYATTASGDGQWVRVRCTLAETDDARAGPQCRLSIVTTDKATLQHSLDIKVLRATDVRFADRSLFFRSDCLSIHALPDAFMAHSPSLQTLIPAASDHIAGPSQTHRRQQSSTPLLEPIHLAFDSRDAANCWNALLRSYAKPEIYGRHVDSRGLYRMWRQVNLTVMHGRNLGVVGQLASHDGLTSYAASTEAERGDGSTEAWADSVVFCEVVIDGFTSGRTMFQKGVAGTPPDWTWLESFTFSDLPPFGSFSIRVWRCKKSAKSTLVGAIDISLGPFRRAQLQEGWFPVMSCVPGGNRVQVGDLKLKLRVDEEFILPSEAYSAITSTLDTHNCMDLLRELDQSMQLGDISIHMLSLAVGRGTFFKDIIDLAEREVANAPNANTLFRGNSVFTKTIEQAMSFFGRPFLEASVGPAIQELCTERIELETDPARNTKGAKDLEYSVRVLPIWCNKFWTNVYKMRDFCPPELRRLFHSIRELVENRFKDDSSNLRWQCISAFCFLRLIVPAILHPHLWGLHPGLPPPGLQRSLTLIAKAIQSLANLTTEKRESHMRGVSSFLEQNHSAMIDYINQISNSVPDRGHPETSGSYDRSLIMQSLRNRQKQIREVTPLASEAIPLLPHLIDIPKHLAVLSSAVIRHSRTIPQSVPPRPTPLTNDALVEDFATKCLEIEAKAVQSVSCLGPPPSANAAHRHSQSVNSRHYNGLSRNGHAIEATKRPPPMTISIDQQILSTPNIPPRKRKSTKRPSTAPAAPSTTNPSTFQTPPSSPQLISSSYDRPSNGGGLSLPVSPDRKSFGKRAQGHIYMEDLSVSASGPSRPIPQPGSTTLRRALSQQLDPREIENIDDAAAKRRRGFLRNLWSRTSR
ncbi:Rho GTPase activation protein [Gautieria morchelliformis]|nr:Rho GTPase activation protein [Gautieria morchelliformis]